MDLISGAAMGLPGTLPDWTNLEVLHRNTLPPRAHFHPYPSEDAALTFDRENSFFQSLNGTWKFHYDASPFLAPMWETANTSSWDEVEVPGMWQRQGYGIPHYTNIAYPFSVTPPNVSYVNPTGSYWREFDIPEDWEGQQIRLRFEGVDSAFHVWVNGEEVGYSQGSRNPSEFDITDYLDSDSSSNTVAARVYQWSDGTYIEDQDQWWLSGIFRDVYLTPFPSSSIVDYYIQPELDESLEVGTLRANITIQGDDGPLSIKVISPDGDVLNQWNGTSSDTYTREIQGDDLQLWSAEAPNLYTVLITFGGRTISQRIGFTRIEMSESNFLVNGKPILLSGVNRHEHHHLSGRTVPYEAMRADLIRMKRSNINAIRTSHQPPHPAFFDVADELGFYIIAEADLECHGFGMVSGDAAEWTSDNPDWEEAYVDRAVQLVYRFRNHASIIMWSLGNECFYGRNLVAMADWIRDTDPTRLIHYEQDHNAESTDMYSQMYSSPDSIIEHIRNHTDKPLIMCEYAHAMGNGPGGLLDYVQLYRREPLLQGGFIWEWANHGLLKREGDLEYYAYGGDFGDEPNDADFIMDGLVLSDHTPMPSLPEYAKVIQPVGVVLDSNSDMIVMNRYDFLDLAALDVTWHLVQDGSDNTEPETLELPRVPPLENRTVSLPIDPSSIDGEAWVNIEFRLKEATLWAPEGHLIAWDQLHITGASPERRSSSEHQSPIVRRAIEVEQEGTSLQVSNGDSSFGFDLLEGNVTWNVNGVDLFQRGPELYFYRAMTQNDMGGSGDHGEWEQRRVGEMYTQVRDVSWETSDTSVTVHYKVWVAPKVLDWGVEADLVYTISSDEDRLQVHASGDFVGEFTPSVVPRIGLLAVMPVDFNQVAWFGRGPGESYKDSKEAGRFGRYESSVDDLFTYYDYPQENGNREELRWLQVGSSGATLDVRTENMPFSFTARRYMPHDLDDAQHPHDLEPLDMTILNLDYDNHGLGSASVGPAPFDHYKCYTEPFDFTFELSII